jgi:hypothetical protein
MFPRTRLGFFNNRIVEFETSAWQLRGSAELVRLIRAKTHHHDEDTEVFDPSILDARFVIRSRGPMWNLMAGVNGKRAATAV